MTSLHSADLSQESILQERLMSAFLIYVSCLHNKFNFAQKIFETHKPLKTKMQKRSPGWLYDEFVLCDEVSTDVGLAGRYREYVG